MARAVLSTSEIAAMLGIPLWRVQRVFELKLVPEPDKVGGRRVVSSRDLPLIIDALRSRGWLSDAAPMPLLGGGLPIV